MKYMHDTFSGVQLTWGFVYDGKIRPSQRVWDERKRKGETQVWVIRNNRDRANLGYVYCGGHMFRGSRDVSTPGPRELGGSPSGE
jgi:hypothetical protein